MSNETANTPVSKIRLGRIQASIWENASEKKTHYNVTFERRYRDSDGNWKSTHSYGFDDLLLLAKAADMAHSKIVELKSAANQQTETDEEDA